MSHCGQRYRQFKRDLLSQFSCIACGESDPLLIDWHHIDADEKVGNILGTSFLDRNHELWWDEVLKCVPLCVCCHRKVHANKLTILPPWPIQKISRIESKPVPVTAST